MAGLDLLKKETDFISLLLKTSKEQRLALLASATESQVLLLTEIFENIKSSELSDEEKKFLRRRKKLFDFLTSKYKSHKERRLQFWENRHRLLMILDKFKPHLAHVLKY